MVENRSEEVADFILKEPNWIVRRGLQLIASILVFLLAVSYFISYPDRIEGKTFITTIIPPVKRLCEIDGRIKSIYIKDKTNIKQGDSIVEIESNAKYNDILRLVTYCKYIEKQLKLDRKIELLDSDLQLGEIGDLFHKLQEEIINYNDISFDKYYQCEIENINSQIKNHEDMVLINTKKTEIFSSALQNEEEFYLISKKLYENGSISRMEFLEKENYFKQQQQQQQQNRIELIKFKIILDDLKKKYKELYHESESKKQELSLGIKSLCQQILFVEKKWKQSYIITAPIDGELHYMASLQGNAQISEKQHLFTIIPKEKKYIAYAIINHEGQGKIRLGNEVYIKVLNFPYEEFGVLEGKVEGISRVYEDQGYKITISLGKELITNYNKKIDYKPEMLGQASIITEKLSILERVFYQFRRLFSR